VELHGTLWNLLAIVPTTFGGRVLTGIVPSAIKQTSAAASSWNSAAALSLIR